MSSSGLSLILSTLATTWLAVTSLENLKNFNLCFNSDLVTKTVYSQDTIAYDLSEISQGNGLSFALDPKDSAVAEVVPTFGQYEYDKSFQERYVNCSAYASMDNVKYVYLCDGYKAVFVTYDVVNGSLTSEFPILIDSRYTCQSVMANKHRGVAYAACTEDLGPDFPPNLVLAILDPTIEQVVTYLTISQTQGQVLSQNLVSYAFQQKAETETSQATIIYTYENIEAAGVKLRISKHSDSGLIKGGYYFTGTNGNIVGVNKDDIFLGVRSVGQVVLLVMRSAATQSIYLQKCNPTPVMSKLQCWSSIVQLDSKLPLPVISFHQTDSQSTAPDRLYTIVLANSKEMRFYRFEPANFELGATLDDVADISNSSLTGVKAAFVWDGRAYLTGYGKTGQNVIVLYRLNPQYWEEKVYDDSPIYSISFIRRGTYDTDVDEHIAVSGDTTYFSLIYKPLLFIRPAKVTTERVSATVNCYIQGEMKNSRSVSLTVLVNINDKGSINVSSDPIQAYTTSKQISVPFCSDDITGNAPVLTVTAENPKSNLTFRVEHINPALDSSFTNGSMKNIQEFFYMGEDMYVMKNLMNISFVFCMTSHDLKSYCQMLGTSPFKDTDILDATVANEKVVTVENRNVGDPLLSIGIRDKFNPSKVKKIDFPGYTAEVGEVRMWGGKVYAMIVGYSPLNKIQKTLMRLQINTTDWTVIGTFETLFKIENHMCIKEIKFSPRTDTIVYLSSGCNQDVQTSRVYELSISTWFDPSQQKIATNVRLVRIFSDVFKSTDFTICPMKTMLAIMDMEKEQVIALDLSGPEDTVYSYPLTEYDMSKLIHTHCDQDNEIFQVIASDANENVYKLITYLGDSENVPTERVHSVLKLAARPSFLAATYNYDGDLINTVLLGQSTDEMTQIRLYTGAPYVTVSSKDTIIPGDYNLVFKLDLQGKGGKNNTYTQSQVLTLSEQIWAVTIKSATDKKIALLDKSVVNLDDDIVVTGPVVKFDLDNTSTMILYDRMYPSGQFMNFNHEMVKIALDEDYVFGTTSDNTLVLYQGNNQILSIGNIYSDTLYAIGNKQGFFALVTLGDSEIFFIMAFLNIDGTWKPYSYSLNSEDIEDINFYPTTGKNRYFFAAVNNEDDSIKVGVIQAVPDTASFSFISELSIYNDGPVNDFDAVRLDQNNNLDYFLVISVVIQSREGKYNLYKVENGELVLAGRNSDTLIPGVKAIHNQIDFSCVLVDGSSNKVDCLHTEVNKNSYIVRYELDFTNPWAMQKFVKISMRGKLNNVVNWKPIRSAIMGDFGAVVVENLDADTKLPIDDIKSQKHLLVIYNSDYQVDPYKIMRASDLGLTKQEDLRNLEPTFFKANTTAVKLGVNVGSQQASIKVFNLDILRLVINSGLGVNDATSLRATQVNGANSTVPFLNLFSVNQGGNNDKKKKGVPLVYFIVAAIALVAILGVLIVFYMKRQTIYDSDAYRSEEVAGKGAFDTENTIKQDQTSSVVPA